MVIVTWVDSASNGRHWVGADEAMGHVVCASVGFVHKKRRKTLVLAQSVNTTGGQVGHLLAIPRVAITKMRKVRP